MLAFLFAACGPAPPPTPPGFEIHPDFTLELVASEPTIFDPVDLEWDERGRVFVLEMPGYPFRDEDGRVVLLDDTDGDGTWDQRQVFAEGLPVAVSILPYRGGLLVASPPDLLFLEDVDDDGVAEKRTVLLSGFADRNTQHNFNGLTHGIDNWIHGANGGNSGEVFWPARPEETVPLRFDDFRIDLARGRFERTGRSSGGFGMSFDSWGRSFSTHNLYHVSQLLFPGRYLRGLPTSLQSSRERISDHGSDGPARIYPIGPQDTRVNHPEQSGHFSGACGIALYTGGSFGQGFEDDVFVADVVLNLVHRSKLYEGGSALRATRARETVEFLASSDRSFRPVGLTVGPDGALYVLDMHRRVIEHPEWIPDGIEAGLDLSDGRDRGRIYRIAPKAGLRRPAAWLDRSDFDSLTEHLGDPGLWWRSTAQRLLVEEQALDSAPALEEILRGPSAHGRLHALWTLEGIGALPDDLVEILLADRHPRVREHAVLVAEPRIAASTALLAGVERLIEDADPRVRLQAALTLGVRELPGSEAEEGVVEALLQLAGAPANDEWMQRAVSAGLARRGVSSVLATLDRAETDSGEWVNELVERLAWSLPAAEARRLLSRLALSYHSDHSGLAATFEGLARSLEADRASAEGPILDDRTSEWLAAVGDLPATMVAALRLQRGLGIAPGPNQREALAEAGRATLDRDLDSGERLAALDLLSLAPYPTRKETLLSLLGHEHPEALQRASLQQLRSANDDRIGRDLLDRWDRLGPRLRSDAGTILLRRPALHEVLLTALEDGVVTLGEMRFDLERRRALLRSRDVDVQSRAQALFSDSGVVTRREALASMRPALDLEGEVSTGHTLFSDLCAQCHRFGEEGATLAPDLTEISRKSAETLLHDIVDPNAAVENEYLTYIVETDDGLVRTGLVRAETDEGFVLVEGDGTRTSVSRRSVKEMWSDGLSLMPEELEVGLDSQAMADLLAFLQQE